MSSFIAISEFDPQTWNNWSEHGVYDWLKTSLKQNNIDMRLLIDTTVINPQYDTENCDAVLIESPDILEWYHQRTGRPGTFYETIKGKMLSGDHKFRRLYTFDERYRGLPNTKMIPQTCYPSIPRERQGLFEDEKTELVTFVTTNKTLTNLHRFRVDLARHLMEQGICKVYGHGYESVNCKSEILRKNMFCFAIENGIYSGYHTEKVMDCFVTGCVPIYIGDPDIDKHYDTRGMIIFKDADDLKTRGVDFSVELYKEMLPHVRNNYRIATEEYTPSFEKGVRMIYQDLLKDITHNENCR